MVVCHTQALWVTAECHTSQAALLTSLLWRVMEAAGD